MPRTDTERLPIPAEEWEWFGDPGHFICARWCRFHLCTLVGDYLVSTVGAYVHPRRSGGNEQAEAEWLADNWPGEEIGVGRMYETMVFRAGDTRCDADGCNCGMPIPDNWSELECVGYNMPGEANRGHLEMCQRYAAIDAAMDEEADDE